MSLVSDIVDNIHLDHHFRGTKRRATYISGHALPIINVVDSDNVNSATTKGYVDKSVDKVFNNFKNEFVAAVRVVLTDDEIYTISEYNNGHEVFVETTSGVSTNIDGVTLSAGNRVLVAQQINSVLNGIYAYQSLLTITGSEGLTISGHVYERVDYLKDSYIPYNLQIPVDEGDVYEKTIFSHMSPGNTPATIDEINTTYQVGVTPITFHKLGIADIHRVVGDNTGLASIEAGSNVQITAVQSDISLSAAAGNINLNASAVSVPSATSFYSDLTAHHIVLNSYGDQGTENPDADQPSTLNGIYFRDPRPYLNEDQWENYTTVNDNLCIRVAPVNGVGDTLVFSSYAGCSFMTQTNLVNQDPKSRIHLKNSGSTALFEVDSTCDISSNDVTGKHFFKTYTTNVLTGDGTYKTNLIPATWDLNPNYTYGFMLYIYSSEPTIGETKPRAWIEYKTKNYTGPSSTNVLLYSNCTVDSVNTSTPDAYQTIMYVSSTTSKIVGEIQTVSGEYYIGVFKRLY
jgi:hypothetical protein